MVNLPRRLDSHLKPQKMARLADLLLKIDGAVKDPKVRDWAAKELCNTRNLEDAHLSPTGVLVVMLPQNQLRCVSHGTKLRNGDEELLSNSHRWCPGCQTK